LLGRRLERRGSYGLSRGVPVEAGLFFRSDDTHIADRIDPVWGIVIIGK